MNAVATSGEEILADNGGGSDSDAISDSDSPEYYEPISTVGDESDEDESEVNQFHQLPNGYASMESGVSSLDLSEEEEVEETAIERAMREEDERRRNAPLSAENAERVMAAMRGISFAGSPPIWTGRVPEDQWIHQIRSRVGRTPPSAAADSSPIQQHIP